MYASASSDDPLLAVAPADPASSSATRLNAYTLKQTSSSCGGAPVLLQLPDLQSKQPRPTSLAQGTVGFTVSPWRPTSDSARVLSIPVFHGPASDALLTAY